MEDYLYQSNSECEAWKGETDLLRGYDPLQEIYHWMGIISLLLGELLLVSYALVPMWNSASLLTTWVWDIPPGIVGVGCLFLFVILTPLLFYLYWQREKQRRDALRQGALRGSVSPLAPTQPLADRPLPPLPMRIESRLTKNSAGLMIGGALIAAFLLVLDSIMIFGSPWIETFLLIIIYPVCLLPASISAFARVIFMRIAGYYLHPSLEIDDEGIHARYGRVVISIAWQNVRYFALVNGKIWSKRAGKTSQQREAFEISDGENRICWLATEPFPSYSLLWFGESTLSARDYTSFTWQLASLIVAKTHLPLLDFRLTKRKQPEASSYTSIANRESSLPREGKSSL